METVKVGGEVNAYCTSCREMRLHNVVAMMGPAPKRVECRSCHKQHNYKANPPGVKAPRAAKTGTGPVTRASAAKAASAAATAAASNQLDSLIAARAGVPARDYKPSERYTAGELVKHASFGIGAVLTTPSPGKIEVQFHDAKRLLLHERAMAAQAVPSRLPPPVRRDDLPRGPSDTPPKHKLPF